MTLFEKVKADFLQARKDRDQLKVALLSTFVGDLEKLGKDKGNREPYDEEVIAVARKYVNNIKEVISVAHSDALVAEQAIIETYIPVQYTEDELKTIIAAMCLQFGPNVGAIMKDLKRLHAGYYDGAMAAKLVKHYTN